MLFLTSHLSPFSFLGVGATCLSMHYADAARDFSTDFGSTDYFDSTVGHAFIPWGNELKVGDGESEAGERGGAEQCTYNCMCIVYVASIVCSLS
jgi:hypothetical protein